MNPLSQFYQSPLEAPAPPLPLLPHCQQESARQVITPFPQQQLGACLRGGLIGSGGSEDKMSQCLIPLESTVSPTSCKGTCTFTSHGPLGMPQNATRLKQEAFAELCICSCRDMSKDHSTPDSGTSPPQLKGPNKNPSMQTAVSYQFSRLHVHPSGQLFLSL
jgi:hypothetical protein